MYLAVHDIAIHLYVKKILGQCSAPEILPWKFENTDFGDFEWFFNHFQPAGWYVQDQLRRSETHCGCVPGWCIIWGLIHWSLGVPSGMISWVPEPRTLLYWVWHPWLGDLVLYPFQSLILEAFTDFMGADGDPFEPFSRGLFIQKARRTFGRIWFAILNGENDDEPKWCLGYPSFGQTKWSRVALMIKAGWCECLMSVGHEKHWKYLKSIEQQRTYLEGDFVTHHVGNLLGTCFTLSRYFKKILDFFLIHSVEYIYIT